MQKRVQGRTEGKGFKQGRTSDGTTCAGKFGSHNRTVENERRGDRGEFMRKRDLPDRETLNALLVVEEVQWVQKSENSPGKKKKKDGKRRRGAECTIKNQRKGSLTVIGDDAKGGGGEAEKMLKVQGGGERRDWLAETERHPGEVGKE